MFSLIVLGYLIFTSIAFLAGANSLIYPRFILDESLGIHADRARGPFLQAVANGVTLNILGLVVLDAHARRRFGPVATYFVIATLPIAILATMTRSVWIAFFASAAWLFIRGSTRTQRVCASIFCLAVIAAIGIAIGSTTLGSSVDNRAQERSSVDLRFAAYEAGWEMFLERPWLGRGFNQMPAEIARRISHRDIDTLSVHNTYLQIFAECGIVGFALFLWLISGMFRLTRGHPRPLRNSGDSSFQPFRSVWAVLLSIYLVNAVFVVMNYQFVNGLLFTLAGIIEARNQSCPRSGAQS
jgi:O-antigen ligase